MVQREILSKDISYFQLCEAISFKSGRNLCAEFFMKSFQIFPVVQMTYKII